MIKIYYPNYGLPKWHSGKEFTCQFRRCNRSRLDPWVGKIPWSRKWQSAPGFLPGESHGWRSLVGYSPWGRKESDTTERLHFLLPHLCPQVCDLYLCLPANRCISTIFLDSVCVCVLIYDICFYLSDLLHSV